MQDDSPKAAPERLLAGERFRRFCLAKFLQLAAQSALIYGLFIVVVRDQQSSLATSAFVLASVVPSVVLSVPAGVIADALPKKPVLLLSLAGRLAVVWLFIDLDPGLETAIFLAVAAWTAYQFFTPAENAALPAVVSPALLPSAISFLQALSLLAQLAGAGLTAPLIIRLGDERLLFWVVFLSLAASALVYAAIPSLSPARAPAAAAARATPWAALPRGLRAIKRSHELVTTTTLRVLVDTGMMMVIVAVPVYVEDMLRTGAENTIIIASPGALGLALGLLLAPAFLLVLSGRTVALAGFILFLAAIATLPWVDELARAFAGGDTLAARLAVTSVLLPLGGMGMAFVQVASRTVVYRSAGDLVSQVLATQSAIGSLAALLPTILAGLLLDLLPIRVFLWLVGTSLALVALWSFVRPRPAGAAP